MKSSLSSQSNASHEKFGTWNPPELDAESITYSKSAQRDQILAVFRNQEEGSKTNKSKNSAIHPAETNQNLTVWQPGIMNSQSTVACKAEWTFIEVSESFSDGQNAAQMGTYLSGDAASLEQFTTEHEVSNLLARARRQAEEIILAAQAEADNVLLQAQSEIDEQKREGYQQGQNKARLEIEDALKMTRAMVDEVSAWKAALMSQGEKILVGMMKDISRKLFGDGAELNINALHTNLNRIMENAHGLGDLNIFLNPKDAWVLDSSWIDQQMLISGGQVKIIPSENITRGGCYVKGSMGTVDGRVETQLGAILKSFEETETSVP